MLKILESFKILTTIKPEARTLVEAALSLGHQVVIATSPFFPKTATLQRLAWAGLSIEQYPFGLVSTYEDFHFAKPNPAYYTEVLAQLGWTGNPAVMIGNHYEYDILPAEMLGFPTYLVRDIDTSQNQLGNPLSSSGTLAEAIPWLISISNAEVKNDFSTVNAMLAVLKATPAAMETLSKDLKSELWSKRTDSNDWAMNEIFCHMRDVDSEVNLPRIQRVLAEADAFVAGIDTDSWAEEMDYIHQNGSQAFADFLKTRVQILNHLSTLSEVDWQKQLRHAIFGPTTFKELINFIVTHDQNHLQQVKQTINRLNNRILINLYKKFLNICNIPIFSLPVDCIDWYNLHTSSTSN